MRGEKEKPGNKKRSFDWFSLLLVTVLLVSVAVALFYYRKAFGSGLSSAADNWSAFGSFIGGIFGPLISFLTLLAILKTIGLQKELLETQRSEFEAMQNLQTRTLESQLEQIERSNFEQERRLVEEARLNLLKILENYSAGLQKECDTRRQGINILLQWSMEGRNVDPEKIEKVRSKISQYEKQLAAFSVLYDSLCFGDYADVSAIKSHYKSEMERICSDPISSPALDLNGN